MKERRLCESEITAMGLIHSELEGKGHNTEMAEQVAKSIPKRGSIWPIFKVVILKNGNNGNGQKIC